MATQQGKTTTYFWILTAQYPQDGGRGMGICTLTGVFHATANQPRRDAYDAICQYVTGQIGRGDFNVQYFQLEPDQL